MRILLTISYDGTDFFGYQIQPNKRTVEQTLNDAIFKITGERVKSIASGRTDSGVHALCQKVHFDTETTIPPKSIAAALNTVLPEDVKVLSSKRVASTFNARYSAKKKTYRYSLYFSTVEEPLQKRTKTLVKFPVDIDRIKEAAKVIEGEHDFKCFLASGSSVKDTVRTVYGIKVVKKGKNLDFYVTGNGFLYNMVRIIVGTLLSVGEGKIEKEDIVNALLTGERPQFFKTMPAKGLCLTSVTY